MKSSGNTIISFLSAVLLVSLQTVGANAQINALKANDFLNSIGVSTHITQGVDNPTNVATALTYCGFRNIRDDGSKNVATLQKFISVHNKCGAKVSLLSVNGDIAASLTEYRLLAKYGALLAAEGPNEPNNWPVTYNGKTSSSNTSMPIAEFQRDLYAAVKSDPLLANIPVFHSSESGGSQPDNCGLQFLTIPEGTNCKMPDGTVYADYANTHNYVCGTGAKVIEDNQAWNAESPTLNSHWDGLYVEYGHTWWGAGFDGYTASQLLTLPRVTTETGWVTRGKDSISEDQQGKLFLNLYDPTVGTAPVQTLTNISDIPLVLSDHPVIIEITPAISSLKDEKSDNQTLATVYTTPTDAILHVESLQLLKRIELLDLTGKSLLQLSNVSAGSTRVDLTSMPKGGYLLRLTDGFSKIENHKIIIH
ncbi:MAG: T9SS type A sorting domain-containing protein [Bacteroidales bacterium]|nr:T9SS type A sorting domain-containing protein [Bacteroidales bacterium]